MSSLVEIGDEGNIKSWLTLSNSYGVVLDFLGSGVPPCGPTLTSPSLARFATKPSRATCAFSLPFSFLLSGLFGPGDAAESSSSNCECSTFFGRTVRRLYKSTEGSEPPEINEYGQKANLIIQGDQNSRDDAGELSAWRSCV